MFLISLNLKSEQTGFGFAWTQFNIQLKWSLFFHALFSGSLLLQGKSHSPLGNLWALAFPRHPLLFFWTSPGEAYT